MTPPVLLRNALLRCMRSKRPHTHRNIHHRSHTTRSIARSYYNTSVGERYYDKKQRSRASTPKVLLRIDGSGTVRLDSDIASLAPLALATRRRRARELAARRAKAKARQHDDAFSDELAATEIIGGGAARGFHAFVLTTSRKKLLDGGRGGVEVYFAASTRGERNIWVRTLLETIEAARIADKAEQIKHWMVDSQPVRHPRPELLIGGADTLGEGGGDCVGGGNGGSNVERGTEGSVAVPLAKLGRAAAAAEAAAGGDSEDDAAASRPIFVLSIDGGGVKGLIPALLLHEIEQRCGFPTHELFDMIGGTSTGGLIALGLGLKRLPCVSSIARVVSRCTFSYVLGVETCMLRVPTSSRVCHVGCVITVFVLAHTTNAPPPTHAHVTPIPGCRRSWRSTPHAVAKFSSLPKSVSTKRRWRRSKELALWGRNFSLARYQRVRNGCGRNASRMAPRWSHQWSKA